MSNHIGKTFENEVYDFILKCLNDSEKITLREDVDFFLPNGVAKLQWPANTAIEVKYRLIYNSFSNLVNLYYRILPSKLIVIVPDNDTLSPQIHNTDQYANIIFTSFQALQIEANSKVEEFPKVKKSDEYAYTNVNASNIFEKAKTALRNNKISIFLGAGISASAGVCTWGTLLDRLRTNIGLLQITNLGDDIVKGRYIIDGYKQKYKCEYERMLHKDIRNILYSDLHPSKLILSVAKIVLYSKIESIISYNYDNLIEQAITGQCYPIYDKSRPSCDNGFQIYHVHGFIPQDSKDACSSIVLGEQEYHKIYQESYNWGNVEQLHALCRSTCFFIGLSMKDPNLRRLIDISIDGSEIEAVHFAFLKEGEHDVPVMDKIMRGFGVNCIWYKEFDDLPNLLESLIKH